MFQIILEKKTQKYVKVLFKSDEQIEFLIDKNEE